MTDEINAIRARINNARERAGFSAHHRGPVELVIIERGDFDMLASIADHYCDIIEAARVLVTSKPKRGARRG